MLVGSSAPGRGVGIENWKAVQGDQILCALFNVGRASVGTSITSLSSLTGLSATDAMRLCEELVRDGYIFNDGSNRGYRLTSCGLDRVYSAQGDVPPFVEIG